MSQFIEMFGNPVANNKGWNTMAIKQVAPEEPSRERQTGTVWILNLDMIESHTGKIIDKVYDEDTNLLSVAPFDEGNVLYSKLRPYLNKVVIPKGKGYATTELVPLRPNQEYLNLTFFSYLLRGDDFVTYASTISSGTKMPRMPLNDLRNFQCILPPMEEQLKFEKVAEQADKSEFVGCKSQFIEMFNKVTETKSLCEICRPKQWPTIPTKDFTEDGYLVYGANGIIGHYSEYNHESPTILMACRGASCGAINISKPYSYITGNAMCMDEIIPEVSFEYLSYFLSNYNYKTIITGGAQPQITYTNLKKVMVPIPPYEEQLKFALIYKQADKSEYYN